MSFIRTSALKLVGALALVASLPVAAAAQSSDSNPITVPAVSSAPAPKAVQPPAPYRWSGVYFGGVLGYGWSDANVTTSTTLATPGYFVPSSVTQIADEGAQSLRIGSPLYGGEAGYDFQVARLVFGGSLDFSVMTINDFVTSGTTYSCCAPSTFAITQTLETNWIMTARGRIGWVTGRRLLIFGTAGYGWMDLKYQAQFSDNQAAATESASTDEIVTGWVYGAGAEWRLTRNLSVKGEYLLNDFDQISTSSTNLKSTLGNSPQNIFTHTAETRMNVVQGSIKFKF